MDPSFNRSDFTHTPPPAAQPLPMQPVNTAPQPIVNPSVFAPAAELVKPQPRIKPPRKGLMVTGFVVAIMVVVGAAWLFQVGQTPRGGQENQGIALPEQDLGSEVALDDVPGVANEAQTLIVNGDIKLQGGLDFAADGFLGSFTPGSLTGNQTYTLPDATGTVCLDANNCGFATVADVDDLQVELSNPSIDDTGTLVGISTNLNVAGSIATALGVSVGGTLTVNTISATGSSNTITVPNASGTICLTSGNCVGVGGYGDLLQGGNSFGADLTIGTNDNFALNFKTNNITAVTILAGGNVGVGTTSPGSKFEVETGSGVAGQIQLLQGGIAVAQIKGTANGTPKGALDLYFNGTKEVSINTGTTNSYIASGRFGIGNNNPEAKLHVSGSSASEIAQIVRGFSSQTADLQQWQNSSGTVLLRVHPGGRFGNAADTTYFNYEGATNENTFIQPKATGQRALVLRALSGQTANLQEWQNSSGTVLANITASGVIVGKLSGTTSSVGLSVGDENSGFYRPGASQIGVSINGTQRALFDNQGHLGINESTIGSQLHVTAGSAGTIGLIVEGAANQTAALQQWHDSAGGVLGSFDGNGRFTIGSATALNAMAQYWVTTGSRAGQVIRAHASQSVNLWEIQDSAGTIQSAFDSTGRQLTLNVGAGSSAQSRLTFTSGYHINRAANASEITYVSGGRHRFQTTAAGEIPMIVQGAASQTADLLQIQNSGGTPLIAVSSNGAIHTRIDGDAFLLKQGGGGNAFIVLGSASAGSALVAVDPGVISGNRVGISVKAAAAQTAALQQWQNSAGTVLSRVDANGIIAAGTDGSFTSFVFNPDASAGASANRMGSVGANQIALQVRGAASQAVNIQEWQNNGGTPLGGVDASGRGFFGSTSNLDNSGIFVRPTVTTQIGAVVRGLVSQSGDLQQWQDSTGAAISKITSSGDLIVTRASAGSNTFRTFVGAEGTARFVIDAGGSLYWGSGSASQDTSLYRSAADTLRTDDNLIVGTSLRSIGQLTVERGSGGQTALSVFLGGEANDRLQIKGDGTIVWGNGTLTQDTNLYRPDANILATDDSFRLGNGISLLFRNAANSANIETFGLDGGNNLNVGRNDSIGDIQLFGPVIFYDSVASTTRTVSITAAGVLQFGSSSDTNLFRSAANVLKTDDSFHLAGQLGIGIAPVSNKAISFDGTLSGTDPMFIHIGNSSRLAPSNGSEASFMTINAYASPPSAGTANKIVGLNVTDIAVADIAGTITDLIGLRVSSFSTKGASATVTNQYTAQFRLPTNGSNNKIGVLIGDAPAGPVTHSLHVASGNSYFAGSLGVGANPNTAHKLLVSGTTGSSNAVATVQGSDSGTNDIQPVMRLKRTSSGTTAAGFGSSLEFFLEDFGGNEDRLAAQIVAVWESGDSNYEGALAFYTRNGTAAAAEVMRISSTGMVGIGTTSPQDVLHVAGGRVRIDNNTDNTNKGCFQFNGTSNRMEFSHDCSTFLPIGSFIGARLKDSTFQTINDTSFTMKTFDSEDLDTDGFHSTSSNTSRITIPAGLGGTYRVWGRALWDANSATGVRTLFLKKNGTTYLVDARHAGSTASDTQTVFDDVFVLAAGDYIELELYQTSGGSLTVRGEAQSPGGTVFGVELLDN